MLDFYPFSIFGFVAGTSKNRDVKSQLSDALTTSEI